MLHITGHTHSAANNPNREDNLSFLLDPEKREEWIWTYKEKATPHTFSLLPTPAEAEREAASLTGDIQQMSEEIFRKRCPAHPRASP